MKKIGILFMVLLFILNACFTKSKIEQSSNLSYCNPLDISYRFCTESPSRREAADPTIILFKENYFLFASKSGGYWHSEDLSQWNFIETDEIPVEEYAPTVVSIGDTLYFLASSNEKSTVYKTANPLSGQWSIAVEALEKPVWDPAFFLDVDNRLYLYWGCSNVNPIYGVEIDYKNNFAFIGKPKELLRANTKTNGWEVPGDYNTLTNQSPWIGGAWMNKHNGRYYLQYSGPGTEFKSYADGVYTAENPLGEFTMQAHNPMAYKPEGFIAGAGHGSTFADKFGNYWHIGTITISKKHIFERRLALFPSFFDENGTLHTITKYGDYPINIPQKKITNFNEIFPGWMLLSYNKHVKISSEIDSLPSNYINDENIRTYWSAKTGDSTEFASIDLGENYDVYALQINFAEHNSTILGRQKSKVHRYTIEYSGDGKKWSLLADKSKNNTDNTHNYIQLSSKISFRYVKINNIAVPSGQFAISDFRIFGKGLGAAPAVVSHFEAVRNANDKRSVKLTWAKSANAIGYNISYGIDKNNLYHNYIVYSDTTLTINSLNANSIYFFTIEAFNENGVTKNKLSANIE